MSVPFWVWALTIAGVLLVFALDLILVDASPHAFTVREATRWVIIYIAAAVIFGIGVYYVQGPEIAGQFLAGYVTEYSLSVDNLFVFVVLIASFAVPAELQHRVLLIGILIALVLRTILIIIGAAIIEAFIGVFFIFGAFLLWTAWKVWFSGDEEPDPEGNALVRFAEKRLPSTPDYDGHKMITRVAGHRVITPMALVVLAIGTTDLLFALDSIPAVFGLTQETYIVFAVNAFALMGLRQLYFLLNGLIDRLVYLHKGLALILCFISVKLILEALHGTTDLNVPQISAFTSLAVIVGILAVTAVASIIAAKRHPTMAPKAAAGTHPERPVKGAGSGLQHLSRSDDLESSPNKQREDQQDQQDRQDDGGNDT